MNKNFILPLIIISIFAFACSKDSNGVSSESDPTNTGVAGSMSKFTFNGNYLYVVTDADLKVYNVQNPGNPILKNSVNLNNNGIETIFCDGSNLFFGTQNGLLIYGLNNPESPNYISTYAHIVSCDPVVVSGNLAFVTISSGNRCNRGANQLEVIDISNLSNPTLLKTYLYGNPKGMAIAGNYLYLCDNKYGFKVLDITDPMQIVTKSTTSINATDVIVNGNNLTITGDLGVYQYDCTDPLNLKFLSKIDAH